jgi:putative SOS response-associated peptidase YedK
LAGDWTEFTKDFELDEVPGLAPRYNIAPTSSGGFEAPILVEPHVLAPARFWFIPASWQKALRDLPTSFNARSETVFHKPFFRGARRCLIPTSGFREFPGPAGKKKAIHFELHREEAGRADFFAFGGLYSEWHDPALGEAVYTFAILTTEPNEVVGPYHHRMPLLVPQESYRAWLDSAARYEKVLPDARDYSHSVKLHHFECSTYGNSTRVEGPACIQPVAVQTGLFE